MLCSIRDPDLKPRNLIIDYECINIESDLVIATNDAKEYSTSTNISEGRIFSYQNYIQLRVYVS